MGMLVGGFYSLGSTVPPEVSATAEADANSRSIGGICWVGIEFRNTGAEYKAAAPNGTFVVTTDNWLDAGTAAGVWIEFTQTGGTQSVWDDGPAKSVRHNAGVVECAWTMSTTGALKSITGYFTFYDRATGGTTLQTTSTVTWSTEYTG